MKARLLYIFLFISFTASAQVDTVLSQFNATINLYAASGSGPTFTIQGIINNTTGQYTASDVAIGDIIFASEADRCVRLRVDNVTVVGQAISATVTDLEGVVTNVPLGIAMIARETANNSFPLFVDGVSADLLACVRTHFTLLVDNIEGEQGPPGADTDSIYYTLNDSTYLATKGDTIPLPTLLDTAYGIADTLYFISGTDTTEVLITDTDTDKQNLSLVGDSLLIERGTGVDLSIYRDTFTDTDSLYFDSAGVVQLYTRGDTFVFPILTDTDTDSIYIDSAGVISLLLRGDTITLPTFTDTNTDTDSIYFDNRSTISLINRGDTIALPPDLVYDGDSSITNELQDIDSVVLLGNLLTVYISNGSSSSVDLSGYSPTDRADTSGYNLTFYISNDSLNLTDGIGNLKVDLSPYLDNTDTDSIVVDSLGTLLVKQRGDIITLIPDTDTNTDEQNLILSGDSLLIDRGTGVDLSVYRDTFIDTNTDGDTIYFDNRDSVRLIVRGDTIFLPEDLVYDGDSSITNELQNLTRISDSIQITNGTSVYIGDLFDNTDNQNIDSAILVGTQLTVYIENGNSATVDLSSLQDGFEANTDTDSIYFNNGFTTELITRGETITLPPDLVNDADSLPTNELQDLSRVGDSIKISNGTGVYISDFFDNTDTDSILVDSLGTILVKNRGDIIYLIPDTDTNTDQQNLSLSGDSLLIESGSGVDLSVYLDNTDTSGSNYSFEIVGTDLQITDKNGTLTVDLTPFLDNTDGDTIIVDSAGVKTYTVNRNDIIYIPAGDGTGTDTSGYNQSLTFANGQLTITDGNNSLIVTIPDSVGGFPLPTDSITFNNNESGPLQAELNWDATLGYLVFGGLGNQLIQIGQDQYWMTVNQSGGPILKGEVVRASDAIGNSGKFLIEKYLADGNTDPNYLLGVAAHDIPNGSEGYVMHQGKIRQIDLTAYNTGQVLYVSPTVAGDWVTTEPSNGYQKLPIAFVVDSSANGTLAVRVKTGEALRDLHDVDVSSPADGSLIAFDSILGYWVTKADSVIDDDADPANEIQTISVSQSSDSITIGLSDSDTISIESKNGIYSSINNSQDAAVTSIGVPASLNFDANSFVIDGSNNRVGIGTASPSEVLDVVGDVEIDGKIDLNDGGNSVYIGTNAGTNDNKTNNRNVGIGGESLSSLTSGALNTGIGYLSLNNLTSGGGNSGIGFESLGQLTTGSDNLALGMQSLGKLISGEDNFAIGYRSGRSINSGGDLNYADNSIFLGAYASPELNGETNQIAIGYNAKGEGSHTIKIGNSSHTGAYIEGIKGQTTASAANVHITADGRLMESITSVTVFDTLYSVGDSLIFITPTPDTFIVTFQTQTDQWGGQVVQSDATLDGTGVTGDLLTLAQQSATDGQVLKWDNTAGTWLPANDIDTDTDTDEQDIDGMTFDTLTGSLTVGITSGTSQTIDLDGRYLEAEVDGDVTNEIQTLYKSNDTIYLTDGGFVIDTDTDTYLTSDSVKIYASEMVTGNTETLINVTYDAGTQTFDFVVDNDLSNYDNSTSNFLTSEVDGSTTNELQNLSLVGDSIKITNGTGVYINGFYDNTDTSGYNSALSLVNDTLYLTDANSTLQVYIPPAIDTSYAIGSTLYFVSGGDTTAVTLSVPGDGWGADTVHTDATLTGNGTAGSPLSVVFPADEVFDGDSSVTNEIQNLSIDSSGRVFTLSIENGNSVTFEDQVDDADSDSFNEAFLLIADSASGPTSANIADEALIFKGQGNLYTKLENPASGVWRLNIIDKDTSELQKIDKFSLIGNTLLLSLESDGDSDKSVTFTNWDTNVTDDFSGSWNDLTNIPAGFADNIDNVNDADSSATNELQTLSWSAGTNGNDEITLSVNNSSITITDNVFDGDSSVTNEIQTIDTFSLNGTTLSISLDQDGEAAKTVNFTGWDTNAADDFDGNYTSLDFTRTTGLSDGVDDVNDADADSTNEIQNLSIDSSGRVFTISIENGNSVSFEDQVDDADSDSFNEAFLLIADSASGPTSANIADEALIFRGQGNLYTKLENPASGVWRLNIIDKDTSELQTLNAGDYMQITGDGINTPWEATFDVNASSYATHVLLSNQGNEVVKYPNSIYTMSPDQILVYDTIVGSTLGWKPVNLAALDAGTDDQTITDFTFNGDALVLSIAIEDGNADSVNLSVLKDGDGLWDSTNENLPIQVRNVPFSDSLKFDDSTLVIDAIANQIGINTLSPTFDLDVNGKIGLGSNQALYYPFLDDVDFAGSVVVGNGGQNLSNSSGAEGAGNTFVGWDAGEDNTNGYYNTFIGNEAGMDNTIGDRNTAVGYQAGRVMTGSNENTLLGFRAGYNLTVGANYNTMFGVSAGNDLTTGDRNQFIGHESGRNLDDDFDNTFIGYRAGLNLVEGDENIFIGSTAGSLFNGGIMTNAFNSIAIGENAKFLSDSTFYEIVIGSSAVGAGAYSMTLGSPFTNKTIIRGIATSSTGSAANVYIDAQGRLFKSTSSLKYKQNIRDYNRSISELMQMRPVLFQAKGDDSGRDFAGFIAEEIDELGMAEFVDYDQEGNPDALNYANMTALLVKTIQDQQKQIEALTKRIEQLENK